MPRSDWPPGEAWKRFSVTPGYAVNFSDIVGTELYWRQLDSGLIVFQGRCQKNAAIVAGDTIGTMPLNYRPGSQMRWVCAIGAAQLNVNIGTNGVITCQSAGAANTLIDLAPMMYLPSN